jgi:malate dehydrogenase (oxaloacetate-decarboxylating)(NADP+)
MQNKGEEIMTSSKRGIDLLLDPSLNKSTAFTETEKQALGILGLVPDVTETEDLQLSRVMMQLGHKNTDLVTRQELQALIHDTALFPGHTASSRVRPKCRNHQGSASL